MLTACMSSPDRAAGAASAFLLSPLSQPHHVAELEQHGAVVLLAAVTSTAPAILSAAGKVKLHQ